MGIGSRDPDPDQKAECFFAFEKSGNYVRILPAENLDDPEWSKAARTVVDFDLNPVETKKNSLNRRRVREWEKAQKKSVNTLIWRKCPSANGPNMSTNWWTNGRFLILLCTSGF